MKYWLITDTHFGHDKLVVWGARPFDFGTRIMDALVSTVTEEDVLIHLGDISFGGDAEWNLYLKKLKCKKWLTTGNHDKRTISWYISHGWDFVAEAILIPLYGYRILLSHIPQPDSPTYDINIHGHFHNTDHRKHEPAISAILTDKHVLLALENNNYRPWDLQKVIEQFKRTDNKSTT